MRNGSRTLERFFLSRGDAWGLAAFTGFWLWFCAPLLTVQGTLEFRDSGHWYRPLYEWIHRETSLRELPLWNPWDNWGEALRSDPAAALFYPGKLIFWLPGSFDFRYHLYLCGHLWWAGVGAFFLARGLGVSPSAATLTALSYAFAGPVYFQACNAIYLVGCAWLPWAARGLNGAIRNRSPAAAAGGAMAIAAMLLGGDLAMAYWLSSLTAVLIGVSTCQVFGRWMRGQQTPENGGKRRMVGIAVCLLAGPWVATAGVWVPVVTAAWQSERAATENSIAHWWDGLGTWRNASAPSVVASPFEPPLAGSHAEQIYQFSQPPWTVVEWIVPNVSGTWFPVNSRWVDQIPGADRMWQASLYQGILPLLMAIMAMAYSSRRRECRLWLGLGVFCATAAMGWYGIGWWLCELWPAWQGEISPPAGGLYWLLVHGWPAADLFRYPAKFIPGASLAVAVLAGFGWDGYDRGKRGLAKLAGGCLLGYLLYGLVVYWGVFPWLKTLPAVVTDWQPLDWSAAEAQLLASLVGGGIILALVGASDCGGPPRVINIFLIILVGCDLWYFNSKLLPLENPSSSHASNAHWQSLPPVSESNSTRSSAPVNWILSGQAQVVLDWRSCGSKRHLLTQVRKLGAHQSLQNPEIMAAIEIVAGSTGIQGLEQNSGPLSALANWSRTWPLISAADTEPAFSPPSYRDNASENTFNSLPVALVKTKPRAALSPDNQFPRTGVAFADLIPDKSVGLSDEDDLYFEWQNCRVDDWRPNLWHLELEAIPHESRWIILPWRWDANWRAEWRDGTFPTSQTLKTASFGKIFLAFHIPPGGSRIRLTYQPWSRDPFVWISVAGWFCLAIISIAFRPKSAKIPA